MPLITIRGQLGSGAPEIGKRVAELLQADYVDRQIIAEIATRLHRGEQDVMEKEMPPGDLLGRIAEALGRTSPSGVDFEGAYLPVWQIPLDDARYLRTLESVIQDLARAPSLVIYGRGAQFILRGNPLAFHVQAVAPLELRVKRVMEDLKLTSEAARQQITRFDSSARKFIKRHFHAEVEDALHYHLVVNTARFSYEAAAAIIVAALSEKEKSEGTGGK